MFNSNCQQYNLQQQCKSNLIKHFRTTGKAKHGTPTYITTHRNKNVNVDKIRHITTK
jgi:hypothetical protein